MKVREAMSHDVYVAVSTGTIQEAANIMADIDAGVVPVADNDRLVGMLTDRDIAIRAVALGKGPDTPIAEVMTKEVKYCFDDEELNHVARNMADQQIRRLPVVNRDKRLVGLISLGDIAVDTATNGEAAQALTGISRPGGPHSQTDASPF